MWLCACRSATGSIGKVGVFDSIIGYESVESPNNPNYTRSFGHSIEPTTHTGILASYRFSSLLSVSGGVADTVGPIINDRASNPIDSYAESYKSYMGSIALTAPESMGFLAGSTLYGGVVNGFSNSAKYTQGGVGSQTSYYAGATVATPVTGLRFGGAFDFLEAYQANGETWSAAGYVSFQATEKFSFHFRGEYLKDVGAGKFFQAFDGNDFYSINPDHVLSLTATAQYDLWKNVIARLELRWDHALSGPYTYGGTSANSSVAQFGSMKNAWMLGANVIYKF